MNENIILDCKKCGSKNRINIEKALKNTEETKCGKCKSDLFISVSRIFKRGSLEKMIHPLDLKALENLKNIPLWDQIVKKLVSYTYESYMRALHYQNYVKIGPYQLPQLHRILLKLCTRLNIPPCTLFLFQSPRLEAYTFGVKEHFIALSSYCLEALEEEELEVLMAHELGHIACGHVLYKTLARILGSSSQILADKTLGIGSLLTAPLQFALLSWDRSSEFSADRISLLATNNLQACLSLNMKSAAGVKVASQLNIESYLKQGDEGEDIENHSLYAKLLMFMKEAEGSHPFPVKRASALYHWAMDGEFLSMIHEEDYFEPWGSILK